MKFLQDLDDIIVKAVNESMAADERLRQKDQEKVIKSQNLRANDENDPQDVEEAEEEEVEEKEEEVEEKEEESIKLKGDPKKIKKVSVKEKEEEEIPGTATSKSLKNPSKKEIKNPSFQTIVKNINLLRGGKSIKDPTVRDNLKDYVEKLTAEERRQVLVYLNSLAQVMAGVKSGFAAEDPEDAESGIARTEKSVSVAKDKKLASSSDVIVVGES